VIHVCDVREFAKLAIAKEPSAASEVKFQVRLEWTFKRKGHTQDQLRSYAPVWAVKAGLDSQGRQTYLMQCPECRKLAAFYLVDDEQCCVKCEGCTGT